MARSARSAFEQSLMSQLRINNSASVSRPWHVEDAGRPPRAAAQHGAGKNRPAGCPERAPAPLARRGR